MRVGICVAGIGPASTGDFIRLSAQAAERAGFSSFWVPDHVVLFAAYPKSTYPYAGFFDTEATDTATDARVRLAEPILAMTWAAAATTRIEVGSNVVILPQRNPLVLAKQLATLDEFSGGRVVLGAGSGWAREEYEAVGVAWAHRGSRMDEYIAILRVLWRNEIAEFSGETLSFKDAYMYPKPVRRDIPILLGGESEPALRRIARAGDGWFAFKLPPAEAKGPVAHLKQLTREQGRDPEKLRILAPIFTWTTMDDLRSYHEAGVTELYMVLTGQTPMDEAGINALFAEMSDRFVATVASW